MTCVFEPVVALECRIKKVAYFSSRTATNCPGVCTFKYFQSYRSLQVRLSYVSNTLMMGQLVFINGLKCHLQSYYKGFSRLLFSMRHLVIKLVVWYQVKLVWYSERTTIAPNRYGYETMQLNPITNTMLCKCSNSNSGYMHIYNSPQYRIFQVPLTV